MEENVLGKGTASTRLGAWKKLREWKTLRTTNVIERVKTQGSRPSEDAALIRLFGLVASGQIKLRRIDGWRKIAGVIGQHTGVAA